ncbi:VOC family protein [Bacillus sp. H-16]|uniref:VOC family protein n=1 Tax=Alteribacter salitolerans TaxID=2912333 RepID=UPI0019654ED4|nr:VOC family protein [Alteribacter salitolerans]MBM7097438.1 VOC family protein [Alteribacter salitolerans]
MINGIYETHADVRNLKEARAFYEEQLGLTPSLVMEERGVIFYTPGGSGQVFGIWEKPEVEWKKSHFAFQIPVEDMKAAISWLKDREIVAKQAFGLDPTEPLVHTWVPMASVYFEDPDGNLLEFAANLPEPPDHDPKVIYFSDWEKKHGKHTSSPVQAEPTLETQHYKPYIPRQKAVVNENYNRLLSQRINRF